MDAFAMHISFFPKKKWRFDDDSSFWKKSAIPFSPTTVPPLSAHVVQILLIVDDSVNSMRRILMYIKSFHFQSISYHFHNTHTFAIVRANEEEKKKKNHPPSSLKIFPHFTVIFYWLFFDGYYGGQQ